MKKSVTIVLFALFPLLVSAQADSVIINVGESSKVIFAIGDKKDLETLKQYDFQSVVNDLVAKLENGDSTNLDKPAETYLKQDTAAASTDENKTNDTDDEDWDESWEKRRYENKYEYRGQSRDEGRRYYGRRTRHSFNFDFG